MKDANVLYTNAALRYLGDEYGNAYPDKNLMEWLDSWSIEDLSDESPQQANDFDYLRHIYIYSSQLVSVRSSR